MYHLAMVFLFLLSVLFVQFSMLPVLFLIKLSIFLYVSSSSPPLVINYIWLIHFVCDCYSIYTSNMYLQITHC